ncbi:hypothetical protein E4T56_gene7004 [Termitomyces sp. T112]|nr:hypothetical protein E4T56_gene7004 [Termitomyces sp. T112]
MTLSPISNPITIVTDSSISNRSAPLEDSALIIDTSAGVTDSGLAASITDSAIATGLAASNETTVPTGVAANRAAIPSESVLAGPIAATGHLMDVDMTGPALPHVLDEICQIPLTMRAQLHWGLARGSQGNWSKQVRSGLGKSKTKYIECWAWVGISNSIGNEVKAGLLPIKKLPKEIKEGQDAHWSLQISPMSSSAYSPALQVETMYHSHECSGGWSGGGFVLMQDPSAVGPSVVLEALWVALVEVTPEKAFPNAPSNSPNHYLPSVPTPANSNASLANSDGSLANSNVFSAATNIPSGSPEPLGLSPTIPNSNIHHQPITLIPQPTLEYHNNLRMACVPN